MAHCPLGLLHSIIIKKDVCSKASADILKCLRTQVWHVLLPEIQFAHGRRDRTICSSCYKYLLHRRRRLYLLVDVWKIGTLHCCLQISWWKWLSWMSCRECFGTLILAFTFHHISKTPCSIDCSCQWCVPWNEHSTTSVCPHFSSSHSPKTKCRTGKKRDGSSAVLPFPMLSYRGTVWSGR